MAASKIHRVCEENYRFAGVPHVCAYCGEPADTIDHAVPRWFVAGNVRLIERCQLVKVPACAECNGFAGGVIDLTFLGRRRRIARAIRKKHKRALAVSHWAPDEMASLGRGMRDHIEAVAARREWLIWRLNVLESHILPRGVEFHLLPPEFGRDEAESA